uniref:helix-turn-helix domain-containing protein n=1 Tax=Schaedlerella arabinosiphila TaxID=2044587 RepID=UPI0025581674
MNPEEFGKILEDATLGSHQALERIFELYDPLISKHCRIDGKIDEDLKQYILIHTAAYGCNQTKKQKESSY